MTIVIYEQQEQTDNADCTIRKPGAIIAVGQEDVLRGLAPLERRRLRGGLHPSLLLLLYYSRVQSYVIRKSMNLIYGPASEPLHISVKLLFTRPLSNKCGTHKTVKARLWPWLSKKSLNRLRCSMVARKRIGQHASTENVSSTLHPLPYFFFTQLQA